jgi:hypothetical protein
MNSMTNDLKEPTVHAPKWTPFRAFVAFCLLVIGVLFLVFGMNDENIGVRDYPEYWAAGQLLVHGGNPYDPAAILQLERLAGATRKEALVSFSPPFALIWALPLGFFGSRTGAILWTLAIVLSLIASLRILRGMYTTTATDSRIHLVGYLFAPVLACIMVGQLDLFLLLGLVLFLKLNLSRPMLAGAALLPFSMKPHLLLPFFLVILIWSVVRRNYRVLLGASAALAAASLLVFFVDPRAWSQYSQAMKTLQPTSLFIPALSVMLRVILAPQDVWIQFVPVILACIWAAWFFWTRRNAWDWTDQGLLLILVSVLCAPYEWFFDQAIVLPAILASLTARENSGRTLAPFGLIAVVALFQVMWRVDLAGVYYLWTAPAWLIWYLYAMPSKNVPLAVTDDAPISVG